MRIQLKHFISSIPSKSKILDVGSGVGQDTEYFVKHRFETIGVDFSEGMVEYAKKKRVGGKFIVLDIVKVKKFFPKEKFDAVWISSVFTHLNNKDTLKVLKQLREIIRQNGVMGIIVLKREKRKFLPRKDIYFNEYWKKEILGLIKKGGFTIKSASVFKKYRRNWFFIIAKKTF